MTLSSPTPQRPAEHPPTTRLRRTLTAPWRLLAALWPRPMAPACITHLYAIDRVTGDLLDTLINPPATGRPFAADDHRAVTSMAAYLLAFLRDPRHLERYAALRYVRIEDHTYGIFVTATMILLVVVQGRRGVSACLRRCQMILAAVTTPDLNLQDFLRDTVAAR